MSRDAAADGGHEVADVLAPDGERERAVAAAEVGAVDRARSPLLDEALGDGALQDVLAGLVPRRDLEADRAALDRACSGPRT